MTIDPTNRVLVAMSGGVDSSVAACLLQEAGRHVVGVFMALTHKDGHSGCCSITDRRDAFSIAESRGFRFMAVDYQSHFDDLKQYFLDEYDAGRTPNPCVRCNSDLKFGELLRLADALHCQWIATGHHAQIIDGAIHRATDPDKDQSYALAKIDPAVLPRLLLPVGGFTKAQVREHAVRLGLRLADKPDSQDLCFIKHDYRDLLVGTGRLTPGQLVTPRGEVIGSHAGYQQFTIGQRRGIGIGGAHTWRVVEIRPRTAEVVISHDPADLDCQQIELDSVHWLMAAGSRPDAQRDLEVQVRYHGETWPGRVDEASRTVKLRAPARAVTPGQLAAFYDGDRLLGGGFIRRAVRHSDGAPR
ncbi:MAG: tRNA 2-thiouridine(34) synthase MnmA [Planctomycetota bacterium]